MNFELLYQGWSGMILKSKTSLKTLPLVIDPAPDQKLEDCKMIVLITHGHPEHVRGIENHLCNDRKNHITIIASKPVCNYLKKKSKLASDRFLKVNEGSEIIEEGWKIRVFKWDHLPLLPETFTSKANYIKKLISNPGHLIKIIADGLVGPPHSPMLGYNIQPPNEMSSIVYFGEGFHRRTTLEQMIASKEKTQVDLLIAGIEPEDMDKFPDLLESFDAKHVVLFEPHRQWRENFQLTQIDLPVFSKKMETPTHKVTALDPNQTTSISI